MLPNRSILKSLRTITGLSRIERWIRLANLLPAGPVPEPAGVNQSDEKTELRKLWQAWNRQFGRKPPGRKKLEWTDSRAGAIYREWSKREKMGALMLEVREPVKRGRGRPAAASSLIRFKVHEIPWMPRDQSHLRDLVRLVRRTFDAIVDATGPGVREIRAGRKFEWHELEPLELPAPEYKPVLFFNPDGRGTLGPDPYRQFLQDLEAVEPLRIRGCPICSRLFFASRKDKGACSPRCLNTFRVREFRNPDKTREYEYNRKLKSAGIKPVQRSKVI